MTMAIVGPQSVRKANKKKTRKLALVVADRTLKANLKHLYSFVYRDNSSRFGFCFFFFVRKVINREISKAKKSEKSS